MDGCFYYCLLLLSRSSSSACVCICAKITNCVREFKIKKTRMWEWWWLPRLVRPKKKSILCVRWLRRRHWHLNNPKHPCLHLVVSRDRPAVMENVWLPIVELIHVTPLNCLTRSIRSKAKSYLCSLFNWTGRDMHEEEWYGSGRQSVKSLRPRPVNIPSSSRSGGTGHGKTETAGCRQKKWRIDDMHGKTSAGVARTPAKLLSVTCIRRPPLSCHCETRVPLLRVQYRTCLIMHVIFFKKHSTCSDDCVYLACRPGFMRSPSRGVVPWLPIFQFAGMTRSARRWDEDAAVQVHMASPTTA
jgi:hypothetical protein